MFIWTDKPFILLPKCQEKDIPDDSCNVCNVILVLLYREQSLRDNSGNSLRKDFENSLQEGVGRFGPCLRKWECLIFEESSLPLSWQAVSFLVWGLDIVARLTCMLGLLVIVTSIPC